MYLKVKTFMLIIAFTLISKSKSDSFNKCSYEYTVDLSKSVKLENNSYLYNNDTLITPDLVQEYNFRILNSGERIDIDKPYKRGCICVIKQCLRFCSNKAIEFYKNVKSSPFIERGFTKNLTLTNGISIEKHLLHDFHPIIENVCENKTVGMLAPEVFPANMWTLYEDGILLRHYDNKKLTQNQYCFDINVNEEDKTLQFANPVVCDRIERNVSWFHKYGLMFSIPFFIIILLLYSFLSNLNNVRGKCFITYLSFVTISYALISFYRISGLEFSPVFCQIYGYVIFYATMSYLTWSCILCYDGWNTLTHMTPDQTSFGKYSIIGFTIPLLLSLLTFTINSLIQFQGYSICAVITANLNLVMVYYDLPGLIVITYSVALYIMILKYSWKTKREQVNYFREVHEPQIKRLMMYFRILILMGFEWIFITFLHLLRLLNLSSSLIVNITLHVSILITALQGLLMFLIFICRSSVLNKIKKSLARVKI